MQTSALLAASMVLAAFTAAASTRIPADTAYLDPDPEGAQVEEGAGIKGWKWPGLRILWFGDFKSAGAADLSLALRLPEGVTSKLSLSLAGQVREATVAGLGTNLVTAHFGLFVVPAAGFQRIQLSSRNASAGPCGDIDALILDGPLAGEARFNLKSRRNAASVHLSYPLPEGARIATFYTEVTAVEDPVWSYYMACGWRRGYMGMQVNSAHERRIIFSVWDSGSEAEDRAKVGAADRVSLVRKGQGVIAGDFGHEGTGGHSHVVFGWKTGATQKFAVTAEPVDAAHTIYSGFFFDSWANHWRLVSSWKAPKDGGWLSGLHSFSENFGGANGHLRRKALYGNQWVRTAEGAWMELTRAKFTCDPTGRNDRQDRFGGVEDGRFFLSHGGFVPGFTEYGAAFDRPPLGVAPVLDLP